MSCSVGSVYNNVSDCEAFCGQGNCFDYTLYACCPDLSGFIEAGLSLAKKIIIGVCVGGGLLLILSIVGCYFCCCRPRKQQQQTIIVSGGQQPMMQQAGVPMMQQQQFGQPNQVMMPMQ
ncbi:Hypothetical_protein [Hexamita inflata]|uniref:Hypothetical_protein n=1 Tax=Hexamita inflata TaxID=28002 RepID=A0AA86RQA8_9EUKA|nr:Hypothetical protein HINF_LOCUS66356 [Hexamita inflata]